MMNNDEKHNSYCRICAKPLAEPTISLKNQPLTDDFISIANPERQEYLADIHIHECRACGFVQNPDDFNHDSYYEDYQYSSGHSNFVKNFMHEYATQLAQIYKTHHGTTARSVLEIGSGDGEQLLKFKAIGVSTVLGVEPSNYLAAIAEKAGVPTLIDLFDEGMMNKIDNKFDICISSYTFDHVRNPLGYLKAAQQLLNEGGILSFEVHSLEQIDLKSEFCLFEHEHTIYLDAARAQQLVESVGFSLISIDPVKTSAVRGNSLIVVARKVSADMKNSHNFKPIENRISLVSLAQKISVSIQKIDQWIESIPKGSRLVGFGAGGRGIMTLAALGNAHRFEALFDSNFKSNQYLAPKTRIPIVGPDGWSQYSDAYCLVFSYGYFEEIKQSILACGFDERRIISLLRVNT